MPIGWAIAVIVLWLAVCFLAIIVLGILRQAAPRLVQEPSEADVVQSSQWGPELGSRLPSFVAQDEDGRSFTDGDFSGEPGVLLFMAPGCGPCDGLAAQLREFDLEALPCRITVVTEARSAETLRLPSGVRVVTEAGREVSNALNVAAVPFAVALDADGVVCAKQGANQVSYLAGMAFVAASMRRHAEAVHAPQMNPAMDLPVGPRCLRTRL